MSLPPLNLVPLTELDAVNILLQSIGQSPVNSLAVPGVKDVSIAQLTLHNVSREVQSQGWWFNTDDDYPLLPDIAGDIALPSNALQVVPKSTSGRVLTERDGKLYNKSDRTFTFATGESIECDIKWFFGFSTLPQVAKNYITYKAGRVFQTNIVSSQLLYQFTKEQEFESLAEMERNQHRVDGSNFFTSRASTNRIFLRR